MTSAFIDVLEQIDSGIRIFEPYHRNARGMTEFQDLAARLIEMERQGVVGRLYTQVREIAGTEYYDLVMVTGTGLTEEGERLLAESREQA